MKVAVSRSNSPDCKPFTSGLLQQQLPYGNFHLFSMSATKLLWSNDSDLEQTQKNINMKREKRLLWTYLHIMNLGLFDPGALLSSCHRNGDLIRSNRRSCSADLQCTKSWRVTEFVRTIPDGIENIVVVNRLLRPTNAKITWRKTKHHEI